MQAYLTFWRSGRWRRLWPEFPPVLFVAPDTRARQLGRHGGAKESTGNVRALATVYDNAVAVGPFRVVEGMSEFYRQVDRPREGRMHPERGRPAAVGKPSKGGRSGTESTEAARPGSQDTAPGQAYTWPAGTVGGGGMPKASCKHPTRSQSRKVADPVRIHEDFVDDAERAKSARKLLAAVMRRIVLAPQQRN